VDELEDGALIGGWELLDAAQAFEEPRRLGAQPLAQRGARSSARLSAFAALTATLAAAGLSRLQREVLGIAQLQPRRFAAASAALLRSEIQRRSSSANTAGIPSSAHVGRIDAREGGGWSERMIKRAPESLPGTVIPPLRPAGSRRKTRSAWPEE